ncbi:hypothetical protein D6D20_07776 [Aureobasidium pullulans]|uniref:Uncharacterized protein n=1 Tax=Aureobasidium pullulans TaxID=5580 RepID=A0A4S8YXR9_AURPU|nr:hypothetical protein D6D20_07776 [Aureobasidium pullulans]
MASTNDTGLTNAVRINCSISQKIHGRPIFESVTVTDRVVETMMSAWMLNGQSSPIARRIGTPLRAYVEHQHARDADVHMDWTYAVYLHLCCELDTEEDSDIWGWAPDCWKLNTISDAYVIREDGQPLCPRYLEALCVWIFHELYNEFEEAMEERYTVPVDNRKKVLALITKENFETYREKFDREGLAADYKWKPVSKMMQAYLQPVPEGVGGKEQA